MLSWISNAVGSISSWLGSGVSSFFHWLLSGLETVLIKVIDASSSFWSLLDSIWDFGIGLVRSVGDLMTVFLPFLPSEVTSVISLALLAVAIAGIYKRVKG